MLEISKKLHRDCNSSPRVDKPDMKQKEKKIDVYDSIHCFIRKSDGAVRLYYGIGSYGDEYAQET